METLISPLWGFKMKQAGLLLLDNADVTPLPAVRVSAVLQGVSASLLLLQVDFPSKVLSTLSLSVLSPKYR